LPAQKVPKCRPWHLGAKAYLLIPHIFSVIPDDICVMQEYLENKLTSLQTGGTP